MGSVPRHVNSSKQPRLSLSVPLIVPLPIKSPLFIGQPVLVWCTSICANDHVSSVNAPRLNCSGSALSPRIVWDAKSIDDCLVALADSEADGKLGRVAQPVRVAVAGGPVSPPICDTLILLGKESSLRRIDLCLEYFASACDA